MKRLIFLGAFLISGCFIIFYLPKTKPSVKEPVANKPLPILIYQPAPYLSQKTLFSKLKNYSAIVVAPNNYLDISNTLDNFKKQNSDFLVYLSLSPTVYTTETDYFLAIIKNKRWRLFDNVLDISEPLLRQHFFGYAQAMLKELDVDGLYLTDLSPCPPGITEVVCRQKYDWWQMSLLDYVSQIRQYFGKYFLLLAFPKVLLAENRQFSQDLLLQADGLVFARFGHKEQKFVNEIKASKKFAKRQFFLSKPL